MVCSFIQREYITSYYINLESKTVIKPIKKFDADLQREDFEDFVELFNQVLINQNIINTEVERMAQQVYKFKYNYIAII